MRKKSLFIVILSLLLPTLVWALEINYPRVLGADPPQDFLLTATPEERLPLFAKYLYYLLLNVSGIVAFSALLAGAFLRLISGASIGKLKESKERIYAALLGTFFLLLSYLILATINPQLLVFSLQKELPAAPSLEDVPEVPPESLVYAEIPLGRLIENVKLASERSEHWSRRLWEEVAERDPYNWHASLSELATCLSRLINQCSCGLLQTQANQCPVNPADVCSGDPCNKTIEKTICQDIDNSIELQTNNLREAIDEELPDKIEKQRERVLELQQGAVEARDNLSFQNSRLKIAEALMRDAFYQPENLESFVSREEETQIRQLWLFGDLPLVKPQDPATFYIEEKANQDILTQVENLLVSPPPDPPPGPVPPVNGNPYPPVAPGFDVRDDLQVLAIEAQEKTGVRAALILSLLYHESGLQRFSGNGRYDFDLCGHANCERIGELNCEYFRKVWLDVGSLYLQEPYNYSLGTIPVSAARDISGVPHCGGAMGPAQAMSFTWWDYQDQIKPLVNKAIVSPWEFEEALVFAGLYLNDNGGAASQKCGDEKLALCSYWGDSGCRFYENYAIAIIQKANGLAQKMTDEGKAGWKQCIQ